MKLFLGIALVLLPIATAAGLILIPIHLIDQAQHGGDWEVDLMRLISLLTMFLLATPSVYKAFKQAQSPSNASASGE